LRVAPVARHRGREAEPEAPVRRLMVASLAKRCISTLSRAGVKPAASRTYLGLHAGLHGKVLHQEARREGAVG
jgi:hypothetical protein